MFNTIGKMRPQIRYRFWAHIGHEGQTLDDLAAKMEEIGNTVLEVDEENQRLLVGQYEETQDRWGCTLCLQDGAVVITDTEAELIAHCDAMHEGWRDI